MEANIVEVLKTNVLNGDKLMHYCGIFDHNLLMLRPFNVFEPTELANLFGIWLNDYSLVAFRVSFV